jgi:hypothetical protein
LSKYRSDLYNEYIKEEEEIDNLEEDLLEKQENLKMAYEGGEVVNVPI